ncbi:hypothetical protein F511_44738 [Dorcoceras hygrometricum]|uniref:Uncharacterized protein n=1 Tax=Dorcoceras hygrometricum TaxID=472368 RepID=A0A2Z7DFG1_9LAMI|nr:hypothetical protein F511_44738 [Dorcoceras hygrometricum]
MSYISPSSTSEGSTRRFDLTTPCTDPIPQPAAIVQQLFAQLLFILCHNTSRNSCFFVDWILCATAEASNTATGYIATAGSLKLSTGCAVACVWIHCSSRQTLATGSCDWLSTQRASAES